MFQAQARQRDPFTITIYMSVYQIQHGANHVQGCDGAGFVVAPSSLQPSGWATWTQHPKP